MSVFHYFSICDAIVLLMQPLVEIVIHDIADDKIIYVNGKLSGRKIGDPSLINKDELDGIDKRIYQKINFDGRLVKSISLVLEYKWLLCINCDVSIFSKMQDLSHVILHSPVNSKPASLFANDWQDKLHFSIYSYLQNHGLSFDSLTQRNKKAVTKHLYDLGAFNEKKAANYVAKILSLGRATIFLYLKEWRGK